MVRVDAVDGLGAEELSKGSDPMVTWTRIGCWADATDEDEQIPSPVAVAARPRARARRKPRIYSRQLLLELRRIESPASPRLRAKRVEELPEPVVPSRRKRALQESGDPRGAAQTIPVHIFDPITAAATCEVVLSWLTSKENTVDAPSKTSGMPPTAREVRALRPNAAEFFPASKKLAALVEEEGEDEEDDEEPRPRAGCSLMCGISVAILLALLCHAVQFGQPRAQPVA
ncbi:unnamed protein product, partial [Symbiodinium pilosum]